VLSVDLARRLRRAGLRWDPARGDHFVLPDRGMDDDVFVISDMTVEVHEFPTATVIGFNGTTEWALDSVEQGEALWIPLEHQLRGLLGGMFRSLRRTPADQSVERSGDGPGADGDAWQVELAVPVADGARRALVVGGPTPEDAYGRALAEVLEDVTTGTAAADGQALGSVG
jgi:hypothetical protein